MHTRILRPGLGPSTSTLPREIEPEFRSIFPLLIGSTKRSFRIRPGLGPSTRTPRFLIDPSGYITPHCACAGWTREASITNGAAMVIAAVIAREKIMTNGTCKALGLNIGTVSVA